MSSKEKLAVAVATMAIGLVTVSHRERLGGEEGGCIVLVHEASVNIGFQRRVGPHWVYCMQGRDA